MVAQGPTARQTQSRSCSPCLACPRSAPCSRVIENKHSKEVGGARVTYFQGVSSYGRVEEEEEIHRQSGQCLF